MRERNWIRLVPDKKNMQELRLDPPRNRQAGRRRPIHNGNPSSQQRQYENPIRDRLTTTANSALNNRAPFFSFNFIMEGRASLFSDLQAIFNKRHEFIRAFAHRPDSALLEYGIQDKTLPQPRWLSALRMLTRWAKRLFGYLRIRTCEFMPSVYACNRV